MRFRSIIIICGIIVIGIAAFLYLTPRSWSESKRIADLLILDEPWVVSENLQIKIISAAGSAKPLGEGVLSSLVRKSSRKGVSISGRLDMGSSVGRIIR